MRAMIHVLEDGDDDGAVAGLTVVKVGTLMAGCLLDLHD